MQDRHRKPATYDHQAVEFADLTMRRMILDPILRGYYPQAHLDRIKMFFPAIEANDMNIINSPIDFIGINNYSRDRVKYSPWFIGHKFWPEYQAKAPEKEYELNNVQYTSMGWEVYPEGLYELLMLLKDEYNNPKVFITENGAAFTDHIVNDQVDDIKRVEFFNAYLHQVSRAIKAGSNCAGYFAWSLLDNFEWHEGFKKRFGLVYVDHQTQQRTIKQSGYWFKSLLQTHKQNIMQNESKSKPLTVEQNGTRGSNVVY
ncbi:glycoside hydrolase family 1 protein [Algibacillus agarilyticus]|uniref:glycoside hydrolase family 1 protein n=1 Tax=Algibacillus agarilyticus TaxID=2234133 RepID=UPI001300902D|nr:family 1 glycosylhydrolase [Algibacillus agarilyticus]